MTLVTNRVPSIGLVEVPALGLYDPDGNNWTALYRRNTLLSKQVLMSKLINYHGGLTKMSAASQSSN
ncbi:hypothetical protein H1Q63_34815 [Desmonostoc muscorum CCALA 125]|nr:hypothetical protein [Desmonostoc muscorum CCALA 125]